MVGFNYFVESLDQNKTYVALNLIKIILKHENILCKPVKGNRAILQHKKQAKTLIENLGNKKRNCLYNKINSWLTKDVD